MSLAQLSANKEYNKILFDTHVVFWAYAKNCKAIIQ